MASSMRILHLITALNVGGAEAMLGRLVGHGRRQWPDVEAHVVSLMAPGVGADPIRSVGVAVGDCGLRGLTSLPGSLLRLASHFRAAKPDLIVAWMYHAQLAGVAGRALAGCSAPIVWNVRHSLHDLAAESAATRAILRANAILSRIPSAIVYNSEVAARQYEALGYRADRTVVIPNGFDLSRFAPGEEERARQKAGLTVAPGAALVGMIARNHPMKDAAMLARAVRLAREAGADIHLLLMGTGMTRPSAALKEALALLPSDRVTLREHRPDIAEVLPALDIVALSSAWGEGFPNVLGEAMASGVPCIATDVGDSARVIGELGIIVPAGDAGAMAAGLLELARLSASDRHELGRKARRRIEENYSLQAVGARYRQLFDDVAGQDRSAAAFAPVPLAAE